MSQIESNHDVLIIGAGPSGAVAAALLVQKGYKVLVLEKEQFPRFSIGESLLPQCMEFIEQAGMLEAVQAAGFQFKNGAAFYCGGQHSEFDFREKFSSGWGTTFQVQRARFDKILADEAGRQGADIRYRHEITAVDTSGDQPGVSYINADGEACELQAKFILDASGFGRVLPRLLDLHLPSDLPVRESLFTHVRDNISDPRFDRNKILINVHHSERTVWYWLIPFSDGSLSLGVVAEPEVLARYPGEQEQQLKALLNECDYLREILADAEFHMPVRKIVGYSADVKSLHGDGFALLGNAGEFLDPVFSSGVTIAMKSSGLAVEVLDKQLKGQAVDWQQDFAVPLKEGVDTFRIFVDAWYDQRFQNIVFSAEKPDNIKSKVCSVLAGYAWDKRTPMSPALRSV